MHETELRPDPLDVLATEFTARQRRGECPTIEEYAGRYPELAEEIRVLFPTIATLEKLKVDQQRTPDGRVSLAGCQLERLGDFRVIREIGRGGMGIVYEAEQQSLARRVAVKVLPRQALVDPKHLQRFQREAQTAAALHHTNIVPVFGVGQHDGFHYYVMQLIDGVGLDRVLARLEHDVASGSGDDLSHIVHELLDESETQGAGRGFQTRKRSSSSPAAGDVPLREEKYHYTASLGNQVTMVGAAPQDGIGPSRRPASPDSHSPRASHWRSVARLGSQVADLTLYELLTLRPAFDQADRTQLLQRIDNGHPPRPRQIQPEIPRDLETIVLKAISREPQHRYESAAALATDLRCFLEDRPIQARRVSTVERSWRWCRRNPVVAGLSAMAVMLLVLVAVTASIGYARTTTALEGERTQRQHAEAATDVAVQVLDRIYERFAPADFATTIAPPDQRPDSDTEIKPVLSEGAAAVLEDLLAFYDQLAESGQDDSLYREKVALASRRVGDIRHHLGQCQQAEAAYQQALDLYRQIDQSSGEKPHIVEVAVLQNELAIMAVRLGRTDEARGQFRSNLESLEQLGDESAGIPQVRDQMVRAREFLTWLEDPDFPPPGHPPGPPGDEFGPPSGMPPDLGAPPPDGPPPYQGDWLPGDPPTTAVGT